MVMMYVKYPLSLRNVEDLLYERGIDICHETVRQWWNRFGPMFAAEICKKRAARMGSYIHWKWHLDEVCVKLNGEMLDTSTWRIVFAVTFATWKEPVRSAGGHRSRDQPRVRCAA